MSDNRSSDTLNTNNTELRIRRFEAAWLNRLKEDSIPDWRHYLPADDAPCHCESIADLVRLDIECRVKAGLPALLSECYFEHPRLQREDARLDAAQQIELIRWEYQQRWHNGQRPRRAEYQSAFPQYADSLREMKPISACPRCHHPIELEETAQTVRCRQCDSESSLVTIPPFVAPLASAATESMELDLRGYQLIEQLGKGGMGAVYCAVDPGLGRDLAIKVMAADLRGNTKHEQRFLREARVTGSLQHPGIVPIHNLGRLADGRLHYTMRLVRGRTFADILKDDGGKPERLPTLLSIFEKICQAVAYAHSKGVIHRDLKPQNVMVGKFGEVQVMDWGLAKVLTLDSDANESMDTTATRLPMALPDTPVDLSRMGTAMGTLAYMPPEQARGQWDAVDERADVFALGCILCEILTGQLAYSRADANEVFRRLETYGADAALTALCQECLRPQREGRPRDAGVVAKRVAAYQAEMQERLRRAEVERAEAVVQAREQRKRQRAVLAFGVLLLIAVAVSIWLAARATDAKKEAKRLASQTEKALAQVTEEQKRTKSALAANTKAWKRTQEAHNTLTDDVMEELLGKQSELGDKEKAFLRKTLVFYKQLAAEHGEGEEVRAVAAQGQFRVAKLLDFLGENADSEKSYRVGVQLYEKLNADFPTRPSYRRILATSHNNLGNVLRNRGKRVEAEAEYRQAIALQKRLIGDFPTEPQYRLELARSYNSLGILLDVQGQRAESEAEYRRAIALQEKLARDFPTLPQCRQELADSHSNLGLLLDILGKSTEAESEFRQAIALQEKLIADSSAVPQYRQALAASYLNQGALLAHLGRRVEAEAAYRKALGLHEKLAGEFPAVTRYRQELAVSHANLGNLLRVLSKGAEAEAEYRQALALQDKLASYFPAVPRYRQDLARSHNSLGILLHMLGKRTEAEAEYRQALELQEQLAADFPSVPVFREELAGSYVNFGESLRSRGRFQEALGWYAKAIPLLETILAQGTRLATARPFLCNAHCGRAEALGGLGRYAESAKDWQHAAELDAGGGRTTFRLQQSLALARASEHRSAAKTVEQLLASSDPQGMISSSPALLYDAACVYALSVAAVKDDGKLREQYAARAIALLRHVHTAGFFNDPKQIDNLCKDTDLDSLRQREDYKKLVAELTADSKKPKDTKAPRKDPRNKSHSAE